MQKKQTKVAPKKTKSSPSPSLTLITGPMFSGKSTMLIRKLKYLIRQKKRVLLFKPFMDTRGSFHHVNCHNLLHHKANVIRELDEVFEIIKKEKKAPDFVFFSEINFFSTELPNLVKKLHEKSINVVCGGLTRDFSYRFFPNAEKLIALATKKITRYAGCYRCFQKAGKTKRLVDNKNLILVGGQESYAPACANCYS